MWRFCPRRWMRTVVLEFNRQVARTAAKRDTNKQLAPDNNYALSRFVVLMDHHVHIFWKSARSQSIMLISRTFNYICALIDFFFCLYDCNREFLFDREISVSLSKTRAFKLNVGRIQWIFWYGAFFVRSYELDFPTACPIGPFFLPPSLFSCSTNHKRTSNHRCSRSCRSRRRSCHRLDEV